MSRAARISGLIFLGVLLAVLAAGSEFLAPAGYTGSEVGITVAVPPSQFNTTARQLREKESELAARDANLQEKAAELAARENETTTRVNTRAALALGVLSALVLLNFYLDFRRKQA